MEGERYVVTWAIGHLVGLKQPQEHDEKYKRWSLANLPVSFDLSDSLKVLPETRHQYKVIKDLIHRNDIEMLINAGDAGREGYLIQEWIYRMAGCRLPKKVLWASSLTKAGIQTAMDNLKENDLPEFQGILREAEARAEGDYILGFNYSPLLTLTRAYRQTLSYGRCQTPLLQLVYLRDKAIREFKSEPYWNVEVTYTKGFKGLLIGEDEKGLKFFRRKMRKQHWEKAPVQERWYSMKSRRKERRRRFYIIWPDCSRIWGADTASHRIRRWRSRRPYMKNIRYCLIPVQTASTCPWMSMTRLPSIWKAAALERLLRQ